MRPYYRSTLAYIDLDALINNVKTLATYHQSKLIAVVKANAYGHGDVIIAQTLEKNGIDFFAVASLDEAINLRYHGITSEILILGYVDPEFISEIVEYNFVVSALSLDWVLALDKNPKLRVHIKVNTGLNRFGINPDEVSKALDQLLQEGIHVEGLYTHFASSDEANNPQTQIQYDLFKNVIDSLNYPFKWIHASNSGAAVNFKTPECNSVRIGLSLYGYSDYPITLKPVMRLVTQLQHVKLVKKGERIGYGGTYTLDKDEWIGTLSIGYADGLHRLYQGACAYIESSYCEYVGRISMDISVIRLDKNYPIKTEVEILGPHIDIHALAQHIGTIPYELMTMISERVPRIYIKDNKEISILAPRLPSSKCISIK